MSAPIESRRGFLRGLISHPLIGGGVTLIGRPSAPVPLAQALAASPALASPQERARYAWEALSGAMREITAGEHGWLVKGGERVPFGHLQAEAWCAPWRLHYERDPQRPQLVSEHSEHIRALHLVIGGRSDV